MKNTIKIAFYITMGTLLLGLNNVNAIAVKATQTTTTGDNATGGGFIATIDAMLGYLVGLLYLVAIIFTLYGGFQILTAGGDEEKVKKGKTTLIQAVIGLFVIFLSSTLVNWIISLGTDKALVQ